MDRLEVNLEEIASGDLINWTLRRSNGDKTAVDPIYQPAFEPVDHRP